MECAFSSSLFPLQEMWEPHVENGRQVRRAWAPESQRERPLAKHPHWTDYISEKQILLYSAIEIYGFMLEYPKPVLRSKMAQRTPSQASGSCSVKLQSNRQAATPAVTIQSRDCLQTPQDDPEHSSVTGESPCCGSDP